MYLNCKSVRGPREEGRGKMFIITAKLLPLGLAHIERLLFLSLSFSLGLCLLLLPLLLLIIMIDLYK